ncbi:unnamed protein product [Leptosia nina]|uniref:C2H2-type domain-containing protein n=1 Tax=Leptosia nina TaxID=320188 RepID=A0AAV1IV93_9NEOP
MRAISSRVPSKKIKWCWSSLLRKSDYSNVNDVSKDHEILNIFLPTLSFFACQTLFSHKMEPITEAAKERYSIKNILFTKAMSNYKIPINTLGYKVFSCTDCGDRFIFESSLMVHRNRKSLLIQYFCRCCSQFYEFYNRCHFLSHVRSHVSKTATINLSDLKVEPLPLTDTSEISKSQNVVVIHSSHIVFCYECKEGITVTGIDNKDRSQHYMRSTLTILTCPVCLFTVPTSCALIAHLRVHLKSRPFYCCECGEELPSSSCIYPYHHDCEGFKMMRVTSRIKCIKHSCQIFHHNNYAAHMKLCHVSRIFKCPNCSLAGYNENSVFKHVMRCCNKTKYPVYYECHLCPGIFLSSTQLNKHLENHFTTLKKDDNMQIYPCWACNIITSSIHSLIHHHICKHRPQAIDSLVKVINNTEYKNCTKCFKKICHWKENDEVVCIYCTQDNATKQDEQDRSNLHIQPQIVCHLCKIKVNENWPDIKEHFKEFHTNIKCLDLKLELKRITHKRNKQKSTGLNPIGKMKVSKHFKQKKRVNSVNVNLKKNETPPATNVNRQITYLICPKCNIQLGNIETFESHIKTHRDTNMAFQCLECGESFAVKRSFSTHLVLEHNIVDADGYIEAKNCFNDNTMQTYKVTSDIPEDYPLEENQCSICRDKFSDATSLEKHFRVHGMAFLIKNTQKSKSP